VYYTRILTPPLHGGFFNPKFSDREFQEQKEITEL